MQKLNALQVRQSLGKVLKMLKRDGEPILIEKDRSPAAVMISVEDYQKRFVDHAADAARRELVDRIRGARLSSPKSSEELLRQLRGPLP